MSWFLNHTSPATKASVPRTNRIMDSQNGLNRLQTGKYSTFLHLILLAVVTETLFLHYKTTSQSDELRLQIGDLQRDQVSLLKKVSRSEFEEKHGYTQLMRDIDRKIHARIKRGITGNKQYVLRNLNALRLQTSRFMNEGRRLMTLINGDLVGKESCRNVTLACEKGERGARGKAGPRGYKGDKGDKGRKGDRGVAGLRGQRGPDGMIGQKGQKGDRGLQGKSLQKPKIVTKIETRLIHSESRNLSLFCEANGYPTPTVRWEIDKRKLNSRYTFPVKGGLSISNINKSDEGRLQCIAENILGKDAIETNLIVHTKPKVRLIASRVSSPGGIPLTILCNAEGKPYPTLKWKRGFGQLAAQQVPSKDNKSLTLRFKELAVSDTGYYVCEAQNYVGRSEGLLLLTVVEKRDCSGYKENGKSGVYSINPDGQKFFRVYCDMETNGGGWTVIQRRADGSVDFFRNWNDYKLGFGNVENEFWLGNDKIHRLTKRKNMMIRFDLEDFNGKKAFAEYNLFYVDGEGDNYKVHIGSYSGTGGDSFSFANGMQFSTKDRDHDTYHTSCAREFHGAWWYSNCHDSNLNGKYLNGPHTSYANGVNWELFKGYHYSLKKTEMKIRVA